MHQELYRTLVKQEEDLVDTFGEGLRAVLNGVRISSDATDNWFFNEGLRPLEGLVRSLRVVSSLKPNSHDDIDTILDSINSSIYFTCKLSGEEWTRSVPLIRRNMRLRDIDWTISQLRLITEEDTLKTTHFLLSFEMTASAEGVIMLASAFRDDIEMTASDCLSTAIALKTLVMRVLES